MKRVIAVAVTTVTLVATGTAWGLWSADGSGTGEAAAAVIPEMAAPSAALDGPDVLLSWNVAAFPDGRPVDRYRIVRYDPEGVATSVATCDPVQDTSCRDPAPPGRWRYAVQALHGAWTGPESPHSVEVLVGNG